MKIERMLYRRYKSHYSDCDTVPDSYDKTTKSIDVFLPDGREKPSGVRGKHFRGYEFITDRGNRVCYRAVCEENARKQMKKDFANSDNWECAKIY